MLCVSFTMQSRNSLSRLLNGVHKYFSRQKLSVSFTMQSRNSLCRLLLGVAPKTYHILQGVVALRVVYYAESKLPVSFTTESRQEIVFQYSALQCCRSVSLLIWIRSWLVFTAGNRNSPCRLLRGVAHKWYHILRGVDALRIVYYRELKLRESFTTWSRQGVFFVKTPRIVYYGELMLCVSLTTRSRNSPYSLLWGVTVTCGELILKI